MKRPIGLEGREIHGVQDILHTDMMDKEFHGRSPSPVKAHFLSAGLANLPRFMAFLENALAHARRYNRTVAVLLFDPWGGEGSKDFFGRHAEGVLLEEAANRLSRSIRRSDCIARFKPEAASCHTAPLGSDAFAICLPIIREPADAVRVARRLLSAFSDPILIEEREVCLTATIGISLHPLDGSDPAALLKAAETAMPAVTASGKNSNRYGHGSRNRDPDPQVTGKKHQQQIGEVIPAP